MNETTTQQPEHRNESQPQARTEQEEIKHTPGPWYQIDESIHSGSQAIGRAYSVSAEHGSALANARLMAAAPLMLDTLNLALGSLDRRLEDYQYVYNAIKAAIVKASGEL